MNDAPLSVLLLAWDDADPTPAALNVALPAGAALRMALAVRVLLTAILPHGAVEPAAPPPATESAPAPAATTPNSRPTPPAALAGSEPTASRMPAAEVLSAEADSVNVASVSAAKFPAVGTVATTAPVYPMPGEQPATGQAQTVGQPDLLLSAAQPQPYLAVPAEAVLGTPVLIRLADFTLPAFDAEARRRGSPAVRAVPHHGMLAPAAPYVGSTIQADNGELERKERAAVEPVKPTAPPVAELMLLPAIPAAELPVLTETPAREAYPITEPDYGQLTSSALSNLLLPEAETAPEPGPAEASDLTQWEDDLTLAPADADLTARTARPAALAALRLPNSARPPDLATDSMPIAGHNTAPAAPGPTRPAGSEAGFLATAATDAATASLSFRIIQYARFATQLTAAGTGAGVIFAADWPTWLAAVEIRQRTGQPLVVYVAGLPSVRAPRRARGWLQAMESQVMRHADLVLVPDAEFGQQLAAQYQLRQSAQVLAPAAESAAGAAVAPGSDAFVASLLPALRAAATLRA